MITPKQAYELEGRLEGELLFVVAPGPTAKSVQEDPSALDGQKVLALNSSIEFLPDPTWWMYADKRFSQIYARELHTDWPKAVIMLATQARKHQRIYKGELFVYDYQLSFRELKKQRRGVELNGNPFWYWPERSFLPGRCSVFSNAMSLALIMKPRAIVLVGVDFEESGPDYYVSSVTRNKGPTQRRRALDSGANWFSKNYGKGVWPGLPPIVSTNPRLGSRIPEVPVRHLTLEEACGGAI